MPHAARRALATWLALAAASAAAMALADRAPDGGGPGVGVGPWQGPPLAVHEGGEGGCLAGLPRGELPLTSSQLSAGRSVFRQVNQSVSAHNETFFAALALADALDERIETSDVLDKHLRAVEVCAFNLSRTAQRADILLALGVRAPSSAVLPSNATLVVAFEIVHDREVRLSQDTALAAIALKNTGGGVKFRDVISFKEHASAVRTYEAVVAFDRDDVLVDLALRG